MLSSHMTAAIIFIVSFVIALLVMKLIDSIAEQFLFDYSNNYPFNEEWDAQVHNWLLEDDLKISWKKPYLSDNVHVIECPLGKIWIGNYPYAFGYKDGRGAKYSLRHKTKLKFKQRLEELGLTFDKNMDTFKDENV